jgi:GWxTD domain-containing protein
MMRTQTFKYNSHFALVVTTIATIAAFLASCSESIPTQSGSFKYLYDYESQPLHPGFQVYHFSDDSTRIYFKVASQELLYTRAGSTSPFEAQVNVHLELFDKSLGKMIDSTSKKFVDIGAARSMYLLGKMDVKLPPGDYTLEIEFSDVAKRVSENYIIQIDKINSFSSQNFIFKNPITGEVIFTSHASISEPVKIETERNKSLAEIKLLHYAEEIKLPPPPFSFNKPELPEMASATIEKLSASSPGIFEFQPQSGIYLISAGEAFNRGKTVAVASPYYPEVKSIEQLKWPLRFITSKTEFDAIVNNTKSKKLIDDFWLECGGSKDRARELIRIYYSRVKEANMFFSSYTEGWRTDRGMIHVIFGNPTKIIHHTDSEIWTYGEDNNPTTIQFLFKRIPHELSDNVFVLNRDPMFKQYWEKMVTAWRNGKIYND